MKIYSLWSLFLQKLDKLVLSLKFEYRCSIEVMYFLCKKHNLLNDHCRNRVVFLLDSVVGDKVFDQKGIIIIYELLDMGDVRLAILSAEIYLVVQYATIFKYRFLMEFFCDLFVLHV